MSAVSQKMRDMSAVAMLAIVMIHSISILTFPEAASWNVYLQHLVTRRLTCWAVPFFFVVSGYWCFVKLSGGASQFFRKKVKTLLVPYALWCLLGLVLIMPLTMVTNIVSNVPILARTAFESIPMGGGNSLMTSSEYATMGLLASVLFGI